MKRVLIADDEIPIVNGLQLLFKRYFQGGYLVVGTAQSGREVIEKSKTLAPDIVLIDVQMPGINGLDALVPPCWESSLIASSPLMPGI